MINILICDDEKEWAESLQYSIERVINTDHSIMSFYTSEDLLSYLIDNEADIIFMDIQMPRISGIEVAKEIYKKDKHVQLIFTSISKDYIQDVFSVKPVYYLVKPFKDEKVLESLNMAMENLDCKKQNIKIVSKGKAVNLIVNKIEYVESNKRIVNFHHDDIITQSLMKLDDVNDLLPNDFVRCHQSYLVNINAIARISNNEIELYSGAKIPVAKSRFSSTKKTILSFWENQI